jgi:hypothetical protein
MWPAQADLQYKLLKSELRMPKSMCVTPSRIDIFILTLLKKGSCAAPWKQRGAHKPLFLCSLPPPSPHHRQHPLPTSVLRPCQMGSMPKTTGALPGGMDSTPLRHGEEGRTWALRASARPRRKRKGCRQLS